MDNKMEEIEFIKNKINWSELPSKIKSNFNHDEQKWKEFVINYSVTYQLIYKGNLVDFYIPKEEAYYRKLIQHSRTNLMLYPYHLQTKMVRLFNLTPYTYYCDMLEEQVLKEKSYDTIPNFTAADCLQLLGVGRNQYIEIMMKYRSNKSWTLIKKTIKHMIPSGPKMWDGWEPWWVARVGSILVSDFENCSVLEKKLIDKIIDENGTCIGYLDRQALIVLHHKNLVIFDVPVSEEDRFTVPKLENFVMNRVQGDYMESLMYKVFVSLDGNTLLSELSLLLDVDLSLVKQAVSIFCRLGMIHKKFHNIDNSNINSSWLTSIKDGQLGTRMYSPCANVSIQQNLSLSRIVDTPTSADCISLTESQTSDQHCKRIAFIYDSTLTAFLMVGNLSQALKTYAMTMFEIGKLTHEMMDDFMEKLAEITVQIEGEAKRYYTNAMNLLNTLKFLRKHHPMINDWYPNQTRSNKMPTPVDMIHNESLKNLSRSTIMKLFEKKYIIIISMAPLSNVISPVGCSSPPFFGPPITEFNSFWYKLFIYHTAKSGPPSILLPQGTCLIITPKIFIGFELLYVATPEQAPLILQRANCLHIINEILKFSCVFIQGYSYDQEVNDKLAYIPFPISEKILALDCPRFKDLSQNLIENLNLNYGFGYITMIKIEKNMPKRSKSITLSECSKFGTSQPELFYENPVFEGIDPLQKLFNPDNIKIISSDNFDEFLSSKKYRWMPFDVVYGIPLFNDELNSKICSNIIEKELFRLNNANNYITENRRVILRLIDFITNFHGIKFTLGESKNLLINENDQLYKPTKPIIYHDGKVGVWSIHNEL